jgi:hypothetical protein
MSDKATANAPDTAVPAPIIEHRTHPRYPFTATVEAYDPATRLRIKGRTSDLSRGGCYVDTISPFGVGTVAKIRFTKDEKTFDVEARVIYSQPSMGMGVMFTSLLPEQAGVIDRWIGETTGEVTVGSDENVFGPPADGGDSAATIKLKEEQQYVLSDLVIALMRKGILKEDEGKDMLAKLHPRV